MPTSEVLRRYGYVTPEYSRYDEVEIPRSAVVQALAAATGLSTSDLTDMVSTRDYLIIASRNLQPERESR